LPPARPSQLFNIVSQLADKHPVVRVNYQKGGAGPLRNGHYIKPVIAVGDWERPWKIDIWAIDQTFIAEKTAELSDYKRRINPEIRELIINYKYSVMNDEHRTPMYSGIFIYQAVLDLGLRKFSDITEYLRKNSIQV